MSSELHRRSSLRSLGSGSFDASGSITSLEWPERYEERGIRWCPGISVHLDGVSSEAEVPLTSKSEGSVPPLSPAVSMSSSSSVGSSLCSSGCDPVTSETDEFSSNSSSSDSGSEDDATREEIYALSRTKPDIYGQEHPIENATLVAAKLQEFDLQIQQQVSMYTDRKSVV